MFDEDANQDSERGLELDRYRLVPHTVEQIDASARRDIGKSLFALFATIVILDNLAMIIATFMGLSTTPLSGYLQNVTTTVVPLLTLTLGYYFGATRIQGPSKRR